MPRRKRPKPTPPIKVYAHAQDRETIARKAAKVGLSPGRYLLMAGLERPERGDG